MKPDENPEWRGKKHVRFFDRKLKPPTSFKAYKNDTWKAPPPPPLFFRTHILPQGSPLQHNKTIWSLASVEAGIPTWMLLTYATGARRGWKLRWMWKPRINRNRKLLKEVHNQWTWMSIEAAPPVGVGGATAMLPLMVFFTDPPQCFTTRDKHGSSPICAWVCICVRLAVITLYRGRRTSF